MSLEQTASFQDLGRGTGGRGAAPPHPLALMGLPAVQGIPVTQRALTDGLWPSIQKHPGLKEKLTFLPLGKLPLKASL